MIRMSVWYNASSIVGNDSVACAEPTAKVTLSGSGLCTLSGLLVVENGENSSLTDILTPSSAAVPPVRESVKIALSPSSMSAPASMEICGRVPWACAGGAIASHAPAIRTVPSARRPIARAPAMVMAPASRMAPFIFMAFPFLVAVERACARGGSLAGGCPKALPLRRAGLGPPALVWPAHGTRSLR